MLRLWMILLFVAYCCVATAAGSAQGEAARLTMADAQQIALANRALLKASRFSVDDAKQNTIQVDAARFPQLTASVTAVDAYRETTTQNGKDVTLDSRIAAGGLNNPTILRRDAAGLALSQLVTDFGRTSSLVESARFSERSQEYQYRATTAQVLLEVSDAYLNALEAQSVLTVATSTVDARQLLLEKIALLAKSKMRSELDVTFAKISLDEAKLLLLKASNAVEAAFARLTTSMGFKDSRHYALVDDFVSAAPPNDLEQMLDRAVKLRPELLGLRSEQQAAVKSIDAARALRYPSISVYAAAGVIPHGDDRLPQQYGAVGINLSVPILEGGKISALHQQAVLKELALEEKLTEAENNVTHNVRVALLNAKAAYENIAITGQLRDGAAQALKLAEARYNLGITSIVELNQAQLAAIGGDLAQSRAKFEYLISRANLEYQLGTIEPAGGTYNKPVR